MGIVRDGLERQLLHDPQVPIATVADSAFNWPGLAEYYSFSAGLRPGKWREAVGLIEQESRRPLEAGFTVPEVDRAVSSALEGCASSVTGRRHDTLSALLA